MQPRHIPFFVASLVLLFSSASFPRQQDKLICNRIFSFAFEHKLIERPMGEVMIAVGQQFVGKPYEANTLDQTEPERLITDLHSFDCVTLVENVLALARCIKSNKLSYDAYTTELRRIRYRNGSVDGYTSRLHYFSDWILDNAKKNIVHDVTKEIGGVPSKKKIDFMTVHRRSYHGLRSDSDYSRMKRIESVLSIHPFCSIPASAIKLHQSAIKTGDIIAITTSTDGLDIVHTGIAATFDDGSIHLLHAPDAGDSVRISHEDLSLHLRTHPGEMGVVVVRPVEP